MGLGVWDAGQRDSVTAWAAVWGACRRAQGRAQGRAGRVVWSGLGMLGAVWGACRAGQGQDSATGADSVRGWTVKRG